MRIEVVLLCGILLNSAAIVFTIWHVRQTQYALREACRLILYLSAPGKHDDKKIQLHLQRIAKYTDLQYTEEEKLK